LPQGCPRIGPAAVDEIALMAQSSKLFILSSFWLKSVARDRK